MAQKTPFASDERLLELASRYPTPFYLYDEAGIRATARALAAAFAWNPGFREYFAVKATPNPAIIQILAEEGCGVDCASETELMLAEAVGLSGDDIMFSSNETPDAAYTLAHRLGAITNLDDESQLAHYLHASDGELPKAMCVRLNPGGTFRVSTSIQGDAESSKYGMTPEQATRTLRALAERGVSRLGVHAFLASNTLGEGYYPLLARTLFAFVAELAQEAGVRLSFVNLSGGIGVPYRPEDDAPDIAAIGEGVRHAYEELLVPAGLGDVAILTELGRHMLAPHGALLTHVIGEKHTYRDYLGIDACSANLMRPMLYGAYHHITVVGQREAPATHTYDVVGGLCEGTDRLATQRALPELHEGALLYLHDVGAHGHSMGYNYNGMLRSAEVLLHADGSDQLIRRAETPADYFATLDVTEVGRRLVEGGRKPARP